MRGSPGRLRSVSVLLFSPAFAGGGQRSAVGVALLLHPLVCGFKHAATALVRVLPSSCGRTVDADLDLPTGLHVHVHVFVVPDLADQVVFDDVADGLLARGLA